MQESKPRVLLTGVTGFLGNHICKSFLDDGAYHIRGTTTSLKDPKKLDGLVKACGGEARFKQVEMMQVDICNAANVDIAVQGCEYVVHSATPVPLNVAVMTQRDQDEFVKSVLDSTTNLLKACTKHKVKRLVFTSSTTSVINKNFKKGHIISEKDWADETTIPNAYSRAKILQEKLVWKYWKEQLASSRFELVVINPGNMIGPFFKQTLFGSIKVPGEIIWWSKRFFLYGHSKQFYYLVDVRDVSLAHLNALKVPDAVGRRFLIVGEGMFIQQYAETMH